MPFGPDIVQVLGWSLVVMAIVIFGAGFGFGRWIAQRTLHKPNRD